MGLGFGKNMASSQSHGTRAPSVSFHFDDDEPGDIILQDILIPSEGLTKCTYYCCLQWNACQNGGGYCGIQDHPDGRNFIFSIWDPLTSKDPIEASHLGHGTKVERFGGEGTGLKSWNFERGWEPNQWYTLVARRWNSPERNNHTSFGFWVKDHAKNEWLHLVTMEFPVEGIHFNTRTCCFVEDWHGTGGNKRHALFKNGFKRCIGGEWRRFQKAVFNVNQEEACNLYNDNYDGGKMADNCIYLQCGSSTLPNSTLKSSKIFDNVCCHHQPDQPPILFTLMKTGPDKIEWNVPVSSTPQLKYTVIQGGKVLRTKFSTETRMFQATECQLENVELILEDILGRQVSLWKHDIN